MNNAMYDIPPEQYASLLRAMLRHENELTNHRVMWLLVGQGFIFNAYISADGGTSLRLAIPLVGILLTLSAFLLLYKSYQARGYIEFLGQKAKRGTLQEEYLPLKGWPRRRIPGWWKDAWLCPWLGKTADVLEPWLFLPCVFMFTWVVGFLQGLGSLDTFIVLLLATILTVTTFSLYCVVMVWVQQRDLEHTEERFRFSKIEGGRR
jgi:hypothetical protein